jgi:hypothetical protein
MKVLEARYHPTGEAQSFLVVGHVLCDGPCALVEVDEHGASPLPRSSVLSNLKYIAAMSVPRPFESLRALDNRFWSFVEVAGGDQNQEDSLGQPSPPEMR